ncbi:F-box/FBD/LRR-repeat protein At4g26340-like [Silene latifolia]|uniref:F-box/FBD/LRR-repeat protein At4g26340-like n=1 Tax=Silene latifolia TaxID=37657 RepID=UPI003D7716A4
MVVSKELEVDRISALSNELVALILSFLQMKDVMKTCILCSRWKYIWTKVPILDFSGFHVSHSLLPSFKSFVYKALLLNDALLLRRFSMDHLDEFEDFHVNSWVWSVMSRNVVEISLSTSVFKQKRLVEAVFSSETLQVLKLNGRFVLPSVIPSVQNLPNLELLHLIDVAFEQNDSLPALLSVCPRLKQVLLRRCLGPNEVHIQSSSLRKLEIISRADDKKVVLNLPKLEYISFTQARSCCEIKAVEPLSCLVDAVLNGPWNGHGRGIIDLLHQSSKLKTLTLAQLMVNHSLEHGGAKLPVFINLSLLECTDDSWEPVVYFLTLPENTPKCLAHSLRFVEINDFCGYGSHLKLAEYILTYAEVLKVMKIYTAREDWHKEMDGLMKLFSVDRASTH